MPAEVSGEAERIRRCVEHSNFQKCHLSQNCTAVILLLTSYEIYELLMLVNYKDNKI